MDFTGRGCARLICILLHFLQVGLLWRCLKLILLFKKCKPKGRVTQTGTIAKNNIIDPHRENNRKIVPIVNNTTPNGFRIRTLNSENSSFSNKYFSVLNIENTTPFEITDTTTRMSTSIVMSKLLK
jgi:hypothetical protein